MVFDLILEPKWSQNGPKSDGKCHRKNNIEKTSKMHQKSSKNEAENKEKLMKKRSIVDAVFTSENHEKNTLGNTSVYRKVDHPHLKNQ
jgi:hypothetical protein